MWKWLSFNSKVRRFEDSYARTISAKLMGIKSVVKQAQADSSDHVVLVAHFADTFTLIEEMLREHQIDFNVPTTRLNQRWFDSLSQPNCNVTLTLAEMLEPLAEQEHSVGDKLLIKILVAELHPMLSADVQLKEYCGSLPCHVQWGYFLSFEDAVIKELIDDRALKILEMFGMGENELINSKLVSSRVRKTLKKFEGKISSNNRADSAAQWLEQNICT